MRSPLNAVIGFGELLSDPATQPRSPGAIAEYGQMIHKSGRMLLEVVDLLVDLVRLQSGVYGLVPEVLSPADIIHGAQSTLRENLIGDRITISARRMIVEDAWISDYQASVRMIAAMAAIVIDLDPTFDVAVDTIASDGLIRFPAHG